MNYCGDNSQSTSAEPGITKAQNLERSLVSQMSFELSVISAKYVFYTYRSVRTMIPTCPVEIEVLSLHVSPHISEPTISDRPKYQ